MRTTLDIEEDVLQAAKELAERQGSTTGHVLSSLARRGLGSRVPAGKARHGVPILPSRGEVVTLEKVRQLREVEGV
jgi:hypothetical protein